MNLPIFQVDAFTSRLFGGNPAAVVPLDAWLDDKTMQNIAIENNLSETAFLVKETEGFRIRWFTPGLEVDLCGHATLGTAVVAFREGWVDGNVLELNSRSGPLSVTKNGDLYTLDFPCDTLREVPIPEDLRQGLGGPEPQAVYLGREDYLVIYNSEAEVAALDPDMGLLLQLKNRGVIVSAPGDSVDFVSRLFAPCAGIPEDPATGSAHTTLTPYWAERLGKNVLEARQISKRVGEFHCELAGDRVLISGNARFYMTGTIYLEG